MNEKQLWYGGLPVSGSRALSSEELLELRDKIREITHEALSSFGLLLLFGVIGAFVISLAADMPVGALILVGFARALPSTLSVFKFTSPFRVVAMRRDLRRGAVNICAVGEWVIEILPDSALVWRDDGIAPQKPVYYRKASTALTPDRAAAAAKFVRPFADNLFAHQRPLTLEEQGELAAYYPRPSLPTFLLPLVSVAGAAGTLVRAIITPTRDFFIPFALGVIATWSGRTLIREWRAWRKLAPDVALGIVLIVRLREEDELGPAEEYLPSSRLLWTVNGVPALWRRGITISTDQ